MKNIHKINNKYHIIKNIYNQRINYGKYTNKKEAQKQRNLLEENNWIKSEKTGYKKKNHSHNIKSYKNKNNTT